MRPPMGGAPQFGGPPSGSFPPPAALIGGPPPVEIGGPPPVENVFQVKVGWFKEGTLSQNDVGETFEKICNPRNLLNVQVGQYDALLTVRTEVDMNMIIKALDTTGVRIRDQLLDKHMIVSATSTPPPPQQPPRHPAHQNFSQFDDRAPISTPPQSSHPPPNFSQFDDSLRNSNHSRAKTPEIVEIKENARPTSRERSRRRDRSPPRKRSR